MDHLEIWPSLAPGESSREHGTVLPMREGENPPITRVEGITAPTLNVYLAERPNGTGVLILPGGGFSKVVPDKEGSEAAVWLNRLGVHAFVLNYRTSSAPPSEAWLKPLQDAQRALKFVRSQSTRWQLASERIGLLGFSAGGQLAARLLTNNNKLEYAPIDAVDRVSHQPDFALLIYPWNIYDAQRDALLPEIQITAGCPPTYLAHTHDDRSSSLGAVYFYAQLKKLGISSELHVYGNGGHGYGMRPVEGSQIFSWTEHAAHWMGRLGVADTE
jgi:acetyl esterase/lipase